MGNGFLGTSAPLVADITLVLSGLVALLLTIGVVLAVRKRYEAHRWVQTSAVTLNIVLVLVVMIGSFLRAAAPGLPQRIAEPYYSVAVAHGLGGLVAFVFGTFVMLRGNGLVPRALRFRNYKLFMRTAYGLYMAATALGAWLYATWYLGPSGDIAQVPQPAAGENELVVPMANFGFNPREVVVPVGATVVWVNQDAAPHTATADDGSSFDSDLLGSGEQFRHTFDTVGEFPYFCTLHGSAGGIDMAGVVRVVPADQAPPLVAVVPPAVEPTPQPTSHPLPAEPLGQPAGTAAFRDDRARSDQVLVDVALPEAPPSGEALVAFLTADDGSALSLGPLAVEGGRARLAFTAPDGANLAGQYSGIVVSREPAGSVPARPSGPIVLEGRLPPVAFTHLVRLLADGPGLPVRQGYAVGLRTQTDEMLRHARLVAASQAAGDLEGVRRHAEHVYNLVVGSRDARFGDLNGDGRSQNPGDGFGLLPNGEQAGYIAAVAEAADSAAQAPDATQAIKVHAGHVTISTENMLGWAGEARDVALRLTQATDVGAAAEDAALLVTLAQQVQRGADANGDGEIAPVAGEGGGIVAYEHAQFMAGLGLVPVQ
ncbi:MAG: plastocyanin/azurin family copper-binding protein [Chloroflexota bacterium]